MNAETKILTPQSAEDAYQEIEPRLMDMLAETRDMLKRPLSVQMRNCLTSVRFNLQEMTGDWRLPDA